MDKLRQKDIVAQKVVAMGPAVEKMIEMAEEKNIDLIAMTSHGRGGLTRVFYGSVAAGVLNRAARPLLVIRSREEV